MYILFKWANRIIYSIPKTYGDILLYIKVQVKFSFLNYIAYILYAVVIGLAATQYIRIEREMANAIFNQNVEMLKEKFRVLDSYTYQNDIECSYSKNNGTENKNPLYYKEFNMLVLREIF